MKKYLRERGDMVRTITKISNLIIVTQLNSNDRWIILTIYIFNFTLGHRYASC